MLADRLDRELDLVLVRKLGAPASPEFAIGSIDESGWTYRRPTTQFPCGKGGNHQRAAGQLALPWQRTHALVTGHRIGTVVRKLRVEPGMQ